MKQNIKNQIVSLLLLSLLACSKENIQEAKHMDKVDSDLSQSTFIPSNINPADLDNLNNIDLDLFNTTNLKSASGPALKNAEASLRNFISQNYIDQFQNTQKLKNLLSTYNQIIIALITNNPRKDDKDINTILDRYYDLLLADCDESMKGCVNLSFFNKDYYNTATILQDKVYTIDKNIELKKNKSKDFNQELVTYYQYLDLIYELKNSRTNEMLDALYIKYSFEYAKHLNQTKQTEKLKEHGSFFENKLKAYLEIADKSQTKIHTLNVIGQFDPCHYSKNNQTQFFKYGQPELLSLSSEFMGNELIKCFSKAMSENKNNSSLQEKSFLQTVETLNAKYLDILNNMDMTSLKNVFTNNPSYLYIIDNLYRRNWSELDAQSLTDKLNLNNDIMLNVVEAYIKYELINAVIKTNAILHNIYYNDKTVTSKNIYSKAIDENLELITIWKEFNDRTEALKRFTLYNLNQKRNADQIAKFNVLFEDLEKNIKYISSVPQMMLLTYKMAQKEFKVSVMGFGGLTQIDTNDIINKFFGGDFPLWFKFVENTNPLKKMELLYAFDFALKTKVFDNFAQKNDTQKTKISPADFFKVVIGRYLRTTRESVQLLLNDTELLNKKNLTTIYKICNNDQYSLSIALKDLSYKTLLGNIPEIAQFHNGNIANALKSARSNLLIELSFVQNLIDLYKSHNPNAKDSIDEETNAIKNKLAMVYQNVLTFETNTSDCMYKLIKKEYAQQQALFEMEKNHIKTIFDKMISLQDMPSSQKDELEATFNQELNTSNLKDILKRELVSEDEYFDKISNNYYYFSKLGVLGRITNYLKEINANIIIDVPSMMQHNDLYQTDKGNTIHAVFLPQEGSYEERLQIFTKNVLEKMLSGAMAQIRWTEDSTTMNVNYLYDKLILLVELLKGKSHNLFNENESFCTGKLATLTKKACLEKVKITPTRVIQETLNVAKLLSLSAQDIEMLKLINLDKKFPQILQERLFFKSQTEPLTLLEKIYAEISDNNQLKNEAETFHKQIVQSRQNLLFMPSANIKSIMTANYAPLIHDSFGLINDFNKAVTRIENAHSQDNELGITQYFYKIDLEGDEHQFISMVNDTNELTYLNPDKMSDNDKIIINFHKDTQNYFNASKAGKN
ncbi:MAG: hypothetical protein A2202_00645 [Bdellovibrionales bacterium RIFOXYA1_FULL_36_14]|nr:MAG: hypothetical protein A2202_00645 [Bdellovibrionales bacterium RIFOXYA1_FULL_36_14]